MRQLPPHLHKFNLFFFPVSFLLPSINYPSRGKKIIHQKWGVGWGVISKLRLIIHYNVKEEMNIKEREKIESQQACRPACESKLEISYWVKSIWFGWHIHKNKSPKFTTMQYIHLIQLHFVPPKSIKGKKNIPWYPTLKVWGEAHSL